MELPEFQKKDYVVCVTYKRITSSLGKRSQKTVEINKVFTDTEEEANEQLQQLRSLYTVTPIGANTTGYELIVRKATPKDHAEVRIQQIAELLAEELDKTLTKEENVLAYDEHEYGKLDFQTPILTCIQDVLDNYPPEPFDPVGWGWVGSDGRP